MIPPDFYDERGDSLSSDKPLPTDTELLLGCDSQRGHASTGTRLRIREGTRFYCHEGPHRVAEDGLRASRLVLRAPSGTHIIDVSKTDIRKDMGFDSPPQAPSFVGGAKRRPSEDALRSAISKMREGGQRRATDGKPQPQDLRHFGTMKAFEHRSLYDRCTIFSGFHRARGGCHFGRTEVLSCQRLTQGPGGFTRAGVCKTGVRRPGRALRTQVEGTGRRAPRRASSNCVVLHPLAFVGTLNGLDYAELPPWCHLVSTAQKSPGCLSQGSIAFRGRGPTPARPPRARTYRIQRRAGNLGRARISRATSAARAGTTLPIRLLPSRPPPGTLRASWTCFGDRRHRHAAAATRTARRSRITVSVAELLVTLPAALLTTTRKLAPLSAAVVAGVVYEAEVAPRCPPRLCSGNSAAPSPSPSR